MGSLEADTEVVAHDGGLRATLVEDWRTFGPNGGYLASVALRAARMATDLARPATLSCVFLAVGDFDTVDIEVRSLRRAKRAEALAITLAQGGRPLLEALVWAVDDDLPGLDHDIAVAPDVPGPDALKTWDELAPDDTPAQFWLNFDRKPVAWSAPGEPPTGPAVPEVRQWMRFRPVARFDDVWVDACRAVVLLDTFLWPAALRGHLQRGPEEAAYIAPSLDLSVRFHREVGPGDWLLVDGVSPVAEAGLMAGEARVWSEEGRLVASGTGQLLCREVPRGTAGSGTTAPAS